MNKFFITLLGLILFSTTSFSAEDLEENLNALISALIRSKPASSKGQFIRRVSLSSTMGPGVKVDRVSISAIK